MLWDFDFYDDVSLCYVAPEIKVSSPVWFVGCLDFCVVCPLVQRFQIYPRFHISKNCTAFDEHDGVKFHRNLVVRVCVLYDFWKVLCRHYYDSYMNIIDTKFEVKN